MSAASLSHGCVRACAARRSSGCAVNARRPVLPDRTHSHHRCRMTTHGVDDDAITCATASPPPFAAELGFTRVRPPISWPKSDKSDFGWRDREGARNKTRQAHPPPPPPPPPGGREHPPP